MDINDFIDPKELEALVIKEATELRRIASDDERNKLNFNLLDPKLHTDCIYGQMTGSCFSDRATHLIEECCEEVFNNTRQGCLSTSGLIGSPKKRFRKEYWSPIELFIYLNRENNPSKNKRLVEFIKGNINELNF